MTKKIEVLVECPDCGSVHEVQIDEELVQKNLGKPEQWYSAREAAKLMGVNRRTLGSLIKSGKLKAKRTGDSHSSPLRISASAIKAYQESLDDRSDVRMPWEED